MHRFGFFALCILIVTEAGRLPKNEAFDPERWVWGGRMYHGLLPRPDPIGKRTKAAIASTFTQLIDHFSTNESTFEQRYFYNDVHYKEGGPAFLMIEGESKASEYWIEYDTIPMMKMAKDHGAIVFVLEHRFYGESQPMKDLSTRSLQYLSSRQALEDIAAFIKAMNKKFGLQNAKWITFGGSYSGALSAWIRLKHPELVYGAVATSGPVQAQVDFKEYLEVVQNALKEQSQQCADNVHKGFMQIQELMKTSTGMQRLKKVFKLCSSLETATEDDVRSFYAHVMSNYKGVVQYSGDNVGNYRHALTVEKLCSYHLDDSVDPVDQLGSVNSYLMTFHNGNCIGINYESGVRCMKNDSMTSSCANSRTWLWQTCTEFGYFQSTDSATAGDYFGHTRDVSWSIKECTEVFGSAHNNNTVYEAIKATNQYYGGRDSYKASRVVLPNGSWDPWHALGILQTKYPDYVAVYMKGTSHCANMYPPASDDLDSLTKGRETIEFNVATWINQ